MIGQINQVPLEIVKIQDHKTFFADTEYQWSIPCSTVAVIKDLRNGRLYTRDLRSLEESYFLIVPEMKEMLLSRSGEKAGIILEQSSRYCTACQRTNSCYIVYWPDGKVTKPCTAGVYRNENGILQIK